MLPAHSETEVAREQRDGAKANQRDEYPLHVHSHSYTSPKTFVPTWYTTKHTTQASTVM